MMLENWGNDFGKLTVSSTLNESILNLWGTSCLLLIISCSRTRVFMNTCCVLLIISCSRTRVFMNTCVLLIISCSRTRVFKNTCCVLLIISCSRAHVFMNTCCLLLIISCSRTRVFMNTRCVLLIISCSRTRVFMNTRCVLLIISCSRTRVFMNTCCVLLIISCSRTRVFMNTCCVLLINILIHVFFVINLCFCCNDITAALNVSHLLGLVAHNEFTKYPSKLTNLQFLLHQCLASAVHKNCVTTCHNRCPIFQHPEPCPVGPYTVSVCLAGRMVRSRHFWFYIIIYSRG